MIPAKEISLDFEPELSDAMIEEAYQIAVDLGIVFGAPAPFSSDPALLHRMDRLRAALPANRMDRYLPASYGPDRTYPCRVPWKDLYVKVDGRLRFCCFHHEELVIGTLEESDFEEIWFGPVYRQLRATVNSRRPPRYCHPASCQVRKVFWQAGLVKEGGDGLVFSSRYPNALRYRMQASVRQADPAWRLLVVDLEIANTGDTVWLETFRAAGGDRVGRVVIGFQLCTEDGRCLERDYWRVVLDRDVAPGETLVLRHQMELADRALGKRHKIDLVNEGVGWFEDLGQEPCWLDLGEID
jgi:hypothetical protein